MKTALILTAALFISAPHAHACDFTSKGLSTAHVQAALASVKNHDARIRSITLRDRHVLVEYLLPTGACVADGFDIIEHRDCQFTARPDAGDYSCQ